MITETLRTIKTKRYTVTIEVVDHCQGCPWLDELYEPTDNHIGGTTIQVPRHLQDGRGYKYYIGQYTPAQLASEYAKLGRENPSKAAYESLQWELAHYIQASDCSLRCIVTKAGIEIGQAYGCSFDWSVECEEDLLETAREMLKVYGHELVSEAISDARSTLMELAA